ncbi:helix-turn-helix domain-containing protein [Parasphingorhabdus sp.]|uniref:helix-turn-helix domain-containing protein n=1 Tax=Parasphingorhabdus sp. TaxID=2709688 RepID=UPI003A8E8004
MKDDDFSGIMEGIEDATAFVQGEQARARVVAGPDIKALRKRIKMTQAKFAKTYHLPLGTVKDWEQGRRQPDAPARALLTVIEDDPEAVQKALGTG